MSAQVSRPAACASAEGACYSDQLQRFGSYASIAESPGSQAIRKPCSWSLRDWGARAGPTQPPLRLISICHGQQHDLPTGLRHFRRCRLPLRFHSLQEPLPVARCQRSFESHAQQPPPKTARRRSKARRPRRRFKRKSKADRGSPGTSIGRTSSRSTNP